MKVNNLSRWKPGHYRGSIKFHLNMLETRTELVELHLEAEVWFEINRWDENDGLDENLIDIRSVDVVDPKVEEVFFSYPPHSYLVTMLQNNRSFLELIREPLEIHCRIFVQALKEEAKYASKGLI